MPSIAVNSFAGSIPRLEPHLLPASAAAKALDCRLDNGSLSSWREPIVVQTLAEPENASFLLQKPDCEEWVQVEIPSDAAKAAGEDCEWEPVAAWWAVAETFALVTGPFKLPQTFMWDTSAEEWQWKGPLKAPPALDAPAVTASGFVGTYSKDTEERAYAYQVRNEFGQWSALSPAVTTLANEGDVMTLSVPSSVSSYAWGIYGVRWYRTVASVGGSMPTLANTMENVMDTQWLRVAEFSAQGAGFTWSDNGVLNLDLFHGLEEDIVIDPADALSGITEVKSMRCFAGFVGKRLYFSENNSPSNWPHYLVLDDSICGLVESNGLLYVATSGHPYVVSAVADEEGASNRSAIRLPVALPYAGCGQKGLVALPQGAAYVSHDGLVGIAGTSSPTLITQGLYSAKQWQQMVPQSLKLAFHKGKVFCFGIRRSFAMTISGSAESAWSMDSHTELSDTDVDDVFTTAQGNLFLRKGADIFQWDAGLSYREHLWESREFVAPAELNFGAGHARVRAGAETLKVFADGREVLNRPVYQPTQFRLPNWAVGTRWSFTLSGIGEVNLVSLATSMRELTA